MQKYSWQFTCVNKLYFFSHIVYSYVLRLTFKLFNWNVISLFHCLVGTFAKSASACTQILYEYVYNMWDHQCTRLITFVRMKVLLWNKWCSLSHVYVVDVQGYCLPNLVVNTVLILYASSCSRPLLPPWQWCPRTQCPLWPRQQLPSLQHCKQ